MKKKYKKYYGKVLNIKDNNSFIKIYLELLCHSKKSNTNKNKLTFKICGVFNRVKDIKYIKKYIKINDDIVLKGVKLNTKDMLCKKIKFFLKVPAPFGTMTGPGGL